MTVLQLFIEYKKHVKETMSYGAAKYRYGILQKYFLPLNKDKEVEEVNLLDINQMYEDMETNEVSDDYLRTGYVVIHSFWKYAVSQGYISESPAKHSRIIPSFAATDYNVLKMLIEDFPIHNHD